MTIIETFGLSGLEDLIVILQKAYMAVSNTGVIEKIKSQLEIFTL